MDSDGLCHQLEFVLSHVGFRPRAQEAASASGGATTANPGSAKRPAGKELPKQKAKSHKKKHPERTRVENTVVPPGWLAVEDKVQALTSPLAHLSSTVPFRVPIFIFYSLFIYFGGGGEERGGTADTSRFSFSGVWGRPHQSNKHSSAIYYYEKVTKTPQWNQPLHHIFHRTKSSIHCSATLTHEAQDMASPPVSTDAI